MKLETRSLKVVQHFRKEITRDNFDTFNSSRGEVPRLLKYKTCYIIASTIVLKLSTLLVETKIQILSSAKLTSTMHEHELWINGTEKTYNILSVTETSQL